MITHMRNKNSNIQGKSFNVINVIFHTIRNSSCRKEFAPSGSKFFPLREVPILKGTQLKRIIAASSSLPFDVRNFFSVLATPLLYHIGNIVIKFFAHWSFALA